MTITHFYEKTGGDFNSVLGRLGSEALIKRFVLKFLNDPSFSELTEAFEKKDADTAFRAAHTLKGVCLNLGFERLYKPSSELTDKLRERSFSDGADDLYLAVKAEYLFLVEAIANIE